MNNPEFYRPINRPIHAQQFSALWKAAIVAALVLAVASLARAQDKPPLRLDDGLYRASQAFVIGAGTWDAIETARGVPYYGEGGWTHGITGNSTTGAVGLNLALDAATLFAAHELAKHGHKRIATALNLAQGALSTSGATTWLGSCYCGKGKR